MNDFHVRSGAVVALRLFDIAYSIDLKRIEELSLKGSLGSAVPVLPSLDTRQVAGVRRSPGPPYPAAAAPSDRRPHGDMSPHRTLSRFRRRVDLPALPGR